MSLAALKKKTKSSIKCIKPAYKRRINSTYTHSNPNIEYNFEAYDVKPNISYNNLYRKYNIYKNVNNEGDCKVVVDVEPDLTGEHRVEVLSTQHLKKENMEKMKHIKREQDKHCHKKNELNYKDDDMSKTALSSYFVINKKKHL